jgi:competence CoiA-like predicted nuclease
MALTAKTLSGIDVFAPELMEKRQEFTCRFCGQPMVFVDAHLKIKHFRHKTESLCDYETETEEHEYYKWLVYKMLMKKRVGEVFAEHRVGKFIADIYLKKNKFCDIVFEIQGTNYSPLKYDYKIISYAFRKLLVVYLFVGNRFCNEIKRNIYSLKEIEKRIFVNKTYCDTVVGCYLNNEYVVIPSFKEKYAKGRIGHCTHRFIMDYNETKKLLLSDYLDDIIKCNIRKPFKPPQCNHNETEYEKVIQKLERYKIICLKCGKFLGWLPDKEAKAKGFTFNRD